jgi:hypothetical protein
VRSISERVSARDLARFVYAVHLLLTNTHLASSFYADRKFQTFTQQLDNGERKIAFVGSSGTQEDGSGAGEGAGAKGEGSNKRAKTEAWQEGDAPQPAAAAPE